MRPDQSPPLTQANCHYDPVRDIALWVCAGSSVLLAKALFVIRERPDLRFLVTGSRPVDRRTSLRCDQTIRFNGEDSPRSWPERMRRVGIFDVAHSRRMAFWTNQWTLPAATISELYRQRWQIEIFFRRVKQNLRICSWSGFTENACACNFGPPSAPALLSPSLASNSGSVVRQLRF